MQNRFQIFCWTVLSIFTVIALLGCADLPTAEPTAVAPVTVDVPADILNTRDIAVEFVRQAAAICVPPVGATWQASKPSNAAAEGAHIYRFVNGDCTVSVAYPDPAPTEIVYYVALRNSGTDFCWQGFIDEAGEILSTGYEAVEPEAKNPAVSYCEAAGFQYEIMTKENGEPCGACVFDDDSACNAWDYLYGTCWPGDVPLP